MSWREARTVARGVRREGSEGRNVLGSQVRRAGAAELFEFEVRLVGAEFEASVRSRVSKVHWRREGEEWKREKEGPGGGEATAESWLPVGNKAQSADQADMH